MKKRILSTFLAFCMVLVLMPGTTLAAEKSVTTGTWGDNLTWSYDPDTMTLTICGVGDMKDFTFDIKEDERPQGAWHEDILARAKSVVIEDGITNIGEYAFFKSDDLTSVTIPDSVVQIGEEAFGECENLTEITIPHTVTSIGSAAFSNTGLTSITIPDSMTSIGMGAFADSKLTNIEIPNSVTEVGQNAFLRCRDLKSVVISEGMTEIPWGMFLDCSGLSAIIIPENITSIGYSAFQGCTGLTEIKIPEGVSHIWPSTFQECSGLKRIVIPDSVTSIDYSAFDGCSSLSRIVIPNGVTAFSPHTFRNCSNLQTIVLPATITHINGAFTGCDSLTDVYYYGSKEQWDAISFRADLGTNEPLLKATIHYNYNSEETPEPEKPVSTGGGSGNYVSYPLHGEHGDWWANKRYAVRGETVQITVAPDKGYELDKLTVTDNRGRSVQLKEEEDGKYSFVMPSTPVEIEASFVPIPDDSKNIGQISGGTQRVIPNFGYNVPYTDVPANAWYYNAVKFVHTRNLMERTDTYKFSPTQSADRSTLWMALGRLSGTNVTSETARTWAMERGISDGTSGTDSITREQLVTMFWRYAGSPAASGSISQFSDAREVSGWALDAVRWAVSQGILKGMGDGTLAPQGGATRAETAALLQQFYDKMGK